MVYRTLSLDEEAIAQDFGLPLVGFSLDYAFTLGAFDQDKLVGIFQASCVGDEADMISIGVLESYRRQGISRNLFKEFLSLRPEIQHVLLEVSKENVPAISLYLGLGFEKIGVRKNYYRNLKENCFEDAYLMKFSCENK